MKGPFRGKPFERGGPFGRASIPSGPSAPAINSVSIVGSGEIGSAHTVSLSVSGYPTPSLSYEWRRDGTAISGATGATYTPVGADDGATLTVAVTATNSEGSDSATSAGLAITYAAPTAVGGLADQTWTEGVATTPLDVSADFTGTAIAYALAPSSDPLPTGLTLSGAGVIAGTPTAAGTATIVVRGTNSGGYADSAFDVIVEAATGETSIAQGGVTFAWDAPAPAGNYADGVAWVVDPGDGLSLSAPSGANMGGAMLNPSFNPSIANGAQGVDASINNYDAALAVASWPQAVAAGDIVLASRMMAPAPAQPRDGLVAEYAAIHVVSAAPSATAMAPSVLGWSGRGAPVSWEVDIDAQIAALPALEMSAVNPPLTDILAKLDRFDPAYGMIFDPQGLEQATLNMTGAGGSASNDNYGRYLAWLMEGAVAHLMGEIATVAEKRRIMRALLQRGRDWYESRSRTAGGALIRADGGIHQFALLPVALWLRATGREDEIAGTDAVFGHNQARQTFIWTPDALAAAAARGGSTGPYFGRPRSISAVSGTTIAVTRDGSGWPDGDPANLGPLTGLRLIRAADSAEASVSGWVSNSSTDCVLEIDAQPGAPFAPGDSVYFDIPPALEPVEGEAGWMLDEIGSPLAHWNPSPQARYRDTASGLSVMLLRAAGLMPWDWRGAYEYFKRAAMADTPSAALDLPSPWGDYLDAGDNSYAFQAEWWAAHVAAVDATGYIPGRPGWFAAGDFSVTDSAGGAIDVTVTALPEDGGSGLTSVEYSDDGGAWTQLTATPAVGVYTIAAAGPIRLRAINALGAGPSSAAVEAAEEPVPVAVDSASLRFPVSNLRASTGAEVSHVDAPNFAPFTDPLLNGGGAFMASLQVPGRTYRDSGASWMKGTQIGALGNGNGGTAARSFSVYVLPSQNIAAGGHRLRIHWKTAAAELNAEIEIGWAEHLLAVMRHDGANLHAEVYEDGALLGRVSAAAFAGDRLRSGIMLGAVNTGTAGAPLTTGSYGAFDGAIGFFGYTDAGVTEADCAAISAGADPAAQVASWRYAIKLEDETTLTPFADALAAGACTATGTGWRKGGDIHPAQDGAGNWIALDPVRDGQVWSVAPGATSAAITLSGKAAGFSAGVEARYFDADGTLRADWTALTGATIAGGVWSGSMTAPRGAGWGHVEVRPATAPTLVHRSRIECGVGHDIVFMGQSQVARLATWSTLGLAPAGGVAASAVTYLASSVQGAPYVTHLTLGPDRGVADGLAAAAGYAATVTDAPVRFIVLAEGGTGPRALIDDASATYGWSGTDRTWSDLQAVLAVARPASGAHVMQWGTYFLSSANYDGDVLNPLYFGTPPETDSYTVDHYLTDGDLPASLGYGVSPITPHVTAAETGVLNAQPAVAPQSPYVGAGNAQYEAWAAANGYPMGPWPVDVVIEPAGGPHQDPATVYGHARTAIRMAQNAMRVFGLAATVDPTPGAPVRSGATLTFTPALPNGGVLQTAWAIAGATPPAGWPTVQGFEVSEDGGATWSNGNSATGTAPVAFTAEIAGGDVVLTRASGTWPAGLRWRYAANSPLDYGLAMQSAHLQHGLLYEGDGDGLGPNADLAAEGGIGVPLRPAEGVAA